MDPNPGVARQAPGRHHRSRPEPCGEGMATWLPSALAKSLLSQRRSRDPLQPAVAGKGGARGQPRSYPAGADQLQPGAAAARELLFANVVAVVSNQLLLWLLFLQAQTRLNALLHMMYGGGGGGGAAA
jgi:hypothetical protein